MRSPWGRRRRSDRTGGSIVSEAISSGQRFMCGRQEREIEIGGAKKQKEKAVCLALRRRWIENYTLIPGALNCPQGPHENVRIFCQ